MVISGEGADPNKGNGAPGGSEPDVVVISDEGADPDKGNGTSAPSGATGNGASPATSAQAPNRPRSRDLLGQLEDTLGGLLGTAPAAAPEQAARRSPAGFDQRAITQQLTDLRAVWQKKLIGGQQYVDGQLRALAPLNRQNTDAQAGLRFLDQLGAAGLVTKNPYRIKRRQLLAAAPTTTPAPATRQAPPAAAPASKPPNCSSVGGYSAYIKRTGNVCFCDTDPC